MTSKLSECDVTNCELGHDGCAHTADATKLSRREICSDSLPTVANSMHTADATQLDRRVSSASAVFPGITYAHTLYSFTNDWCLGVLLGVYITKRNRLCRLKARYTSKAVDALKLLISFSREVPVRRQLRSVDDIRS